MSPEFPFELVTVAGSEAVETCMQLRQQGKNVFTPVILGGKNNVEMIQENMEFGKSSTEEILKLASTIDARQVLAKRREQEPEYFDEVEEGVWPRGSLEPQNLTAHTDILSRKPKPVVY